MGKNEKIAVISHTFNSGCYMTENPSAAPQSIVSLLSHLTGNTIQFLNNLEGHHALIVSRVGDNSAAERGGVNSFALLFGENFAEQLMRRPAAVFKVADWLLEMGDAAATSLNKLPSLLDELDDSRYCDMPFTDGMLTACAVALAVSMNGKNNFCFVDDLSKDGLLAVLYALPPSLRGKISFSYGYCKACPASLRLIARNATDPKYEVPPAVMPYTTSDIDTIIAEILEVKQEALAAVLGEGVSPHAVTWTPGLLLELASWEPAAAPQRETASAPVAPHPRERQQPRERRRGEQAALVRRNAALSLTRKLLLLLCTAVLLFYGFRTGSSVIGDEVYLRLYLNLSMGDLLRAAAVFAAGWLARSLFVKRK